jgi:hypothetical protein
MNNWQKKLPKTGIGRPSKRNVFEHAIGYLQQAVQSNRNLANENKVCKQGLAYHKRRLAAWFAESSRVPAGSASRASSVAAHVGGQHPDAAAADGWRYHVATDGTARCMHGWQAAM